MAGVGGGVSNSVGLCGMPASGAGIVSAVDGVSNTVGAMPLGGVSNNVDCRECTVAGSAGIAAGIAGPSPH